MIRERENKKEQITFLTLTFLVVYSCSYLLSDTFGRFMLRYGDPFVSSANQPVSYMNLAFTVLVLTLVITIRLLIKRTDFKKTVSALAVGGCLTALIVAGYFVNCNFTASAMEDRAVLDHFFYKTSDEKLNEKYDENETKEIIRLCKQLKPVSENEQRKLEKN